MSQRLLEWPGAHASPTSNRLASGDVPEKQAAEPSLLTPQALTQLLTTSQPVKKAEAAVLASERLKEVVYAFTRPGQVSGSPTVSLKNLVGLFQGNVSVGALFSGDLSVKLTDSTNRAQRELAEAQKKAAESILEVESQQVQFAMNDILLKASWIKTRLTDLLAVEESQKKILAVYQNIQRNSPSPANDAKKLYAERQLDTTQALIQKAKRELTDELNNLKRLSDKSDLSVDQIPSIPVTTGGLPAFQISQSKAINSLTDADLNTYAESNPEVKKLDVAIVVIKSKINALEAASKSTRSSVNILSFLNSIKKAIENPINALLGLTSITAKKDVTVERALAESKEQLKLLIEQRKILVDAVGMDLKLRRNDLNRQDDGSLQKRLDSALALVRNSRDAFSLKTNLLKNSPSPLNRVGMLEAKVEYLRSISAYKQEGASFLKDANSFIYLTGEMKERGTLFSTFNRNFSAQFGIPQQNSGSR